MALQDLTPQLRTRLSRLERVVGLFVTLAVILFLAGFAYYAYKTGQRKGWFITKMPYYTYVDDAAGLNVGDNVILMGFPAGEITRIEAMPPFQNYNVYVEFEVHEPYYGYLWKDSRAAVAPANLLGARVIEVTKGTNAFPIPSYIEFELKTLTVDEALRAVETNNFAFNETVAAPDGSNWLVQVFQKVTEESLRQLQALGHDRVDVIDRNAKSPRVSGIYVDQTGSYTNFVRGVHRYMLPPDESPALAERAKQVIHLVETTLPNILDLTNQLSRVLSNAASLTARAENLVRDVQPAATNAAIITAQLRNPDGALGQWLLSSNLWQQIEATLQSAQSVAHRADGAVVATQDQLQQLSTGLLVNLEYLAGITSNLNAQVQANEFILSDLSELIRSTDDMVQGLKRHWLLKGPFTTPGTNAAPQSILEPSLGNAP